MKKLFLLLAMVGLAFASCTPGAEEPGSGSQGGSDEFTLSVENIGEYGAVVTVTPKDETRTYFWSVTKKSNMDEAGGAAAWMNYVHKSNKEAVQNGYESWTEGEAPLLSTGVESKELKSLNPDTEYMLYAFGVDANGNLTSTNLSYQIFTTLPSTFDTSVWAGIWNVTSTQVYAEQLSDGGTQYAKGIVPTPDGYTRPVEITDGASIDPSLAGYALVYGWDGAFHGLPSAGAENYMPAFATYQGNSLQFLNEEVVYQQEGLIFQWYGICDIDGEESIVSGDYAPYQFKMDQDGNVTLVAYSGIVTSGAKFVCVLYQILGIEGESYYSSYFYTEEAMNDEPIYHFSGETMTAVKADTGAAAPLKLSAKKDVRIMHKYANAKVAAREFSSAVKLAKLGKLAK